MTSLPTLSEITSSRGSPDSPLATALSTLFEPSAVLLEKLVPELSSSLPPSIETYSSLIDLTISQINSWDFQPKAAFIAAHPRIGEVRNLSHLSHKEQAAKSTSAEVLGRLAYLNTLYEQRYPGLRYITFVNGRSRAEIKDEMEDKLRPLRVGAPSEPGVDVEDFTPLKIDGPEWLEELDRAIGDVGKIAKGRLDALGVV